MKRRLFAAAAFLALASSTLAHGEPRLLHVPPAQQHAEQGILTPVPIRVDLPPDLDTARVLVHYRVRGSPTWTTLELRREGAGTRFVGAIPCLEVSTITGDLAYYIRVHDADGAVLAYVGTRASPFVVTVLHESERPDLKAGARCPDPADCPRGLPGCPSEEVERVPCRADADCEGGAVCSWEGFCEDVVRKRNWISLDVSGALGLFSGTGACSIASQENAGTACYRQTDGERYLGHAVYTNEPLVFARAPLRVELGYERVLFYDTTLTARLGYAFFGAGPEDVSATPFIPLSASLGARYFPGHDPFATRGLKGFVSASGGFSMFDLEGSVHVREDTTPLLAAQGGNDLEQTLDVWRRAGDAFVSVGTGAVLWSSPGFAFHAEVDVAQTFPHAATIGTLRVGAATGF
ncbi:MAG TPA: hypothetical protein VMS65_15610 [Polyangiaceae bacterium]|nr:hypothetical protein [Polyangiaceae bacterium]